MSLRDISDSAPFPSEEFADVMSSNSRFAATFEDKGLSGTALRGLAIVTCMDSRISPLEITGMGTGDVKIVRNAGARVTEDVLRTLVLATYLLGVTRVLVMPHTQCRMASGDEAKIHEAIRIQSGVDTRSMEFRTVADQESALVTDVQRIRSFPLLPSNLVVAGAIYDVHTGRLEPVNA